MEELQIYSIFLNLRETTAWANNIIALDIMC